MRASLNWRHALMSWMPSFCSINWNQTLIESIPRGGEREHANAVRLGLMESHILFLCDNMNIRNLIHTKACCEGRGRWGIFSSPYVMFVAPVELAARLADKLMTDAMQSDEHRLHFHWTVEGHFWEGPLTFCLSIPGIERYSWVSRQRLNADIEAIGEMMQIAVREFCWANPLHNADAL